MVQWQGSAGLATSATSVNVSETNGSPSTGDYRLVIIMISNSRTVTTPSGWTSHYGSLVTGSSTTRFYVFGKAWVSGEGTTTFSFSGSAAFCAGILNIKERNSTSLFDVTATTTRVTGPATEIAMPSITTVDPKALRIDMVAASYGTSGANTVTFTVPSETDSNVVYKPSTGTGVPSVFASDDIPTPGSTGTRTFSTSNSADNFYGGTFALSTVLQQGAVSLTSTPTITVGGTLQKEGAVSLSASSTLTAGVSSQVHTSAVSLTPTASLSVAGIVTQLGTISLSSIYTLTAGVSSQAQWGALSLTADTTLAVTADRTAVSSVDLSVTATLSTVSGQTHDSSVALESSASFSAAAVVSNMAALSLNAVMTIEITASLIAVSSVSLVASPDLTTDAISFSIVEGSLVLTAESTILASATNVVFASLSLNAEPILTAVAVVESYSTISLSVVPSLNTGEATVIALGSVSLISDYTLYVGSEETDYFGILSMAVSASFNALAVLDAVSLISMSVLTTLDALEIRSTFGVIALVSDISFNALAIVTSAGVANMMAYCTFASSAVVATNGSVSLIVVTEINSLISATRFLSASLIASPELFVSGFGTFSAAISMIAVYSTLFLSIFEDVPRPIRFNGMSASVGNGGLKMRPPIRTISQRQPQNEGMLKWKERPGPLLSIKPS